MRERLPDAQRAARPRRRSRCQRRSAPSQPSLSWTAVTPREAASLQPVAHRVDVLVVGRSRRSASRKCQADSSRRTPVGSPRSSRSTTPPGDLEVAVRARERGRVEPERVVVACHQRRRDVAGDRVERLLRRLDGRRPVAAPPAAAAQPAARPRRAPSASRTRASASSSDARALEPDLALRERPGREVDVRVGEAGEDAAAAEVDPLRARRAPSRACRRRRRSGRRRSRAPRATGSDGSSVRIDAVLEDHVDRDRTAADDAAVAREAFVDHLTLRVSDPEASRRFYRAALEPWGSRELEAADWGIAFGPPGSEDLAVAEGEPSGPLHVAFAAPDRDDGRPLPRGRAGRGRPRQRRARRAAAYHAGYYAAFVLDPTATTSRPSSTAAANRPDPSASGLDSENRDGPQVIVVGHFRRQPGSERSRRGHLRGSRRERWLSPEPQRPRRAHTAASWLRPGLWLLAFAAGATALLMTVAKRASRASTPRGL